MQVHKWNFETHSYEPYDIPFDWVCPIICDDMDKPVNCASCGRLMLYGDGFTSRQIHTSRGLGFSVCADCYEHETGMKEAR